MTTIAVVNTLDDDPGSSLRVTAFDTTHNQNKTLAEFFNGPDPVLNLYAQTQVDGTAILTRLAAKADVSALAAVATSGSYADLTGKPSIPAAQIQADWNQAVTTAADFVKNKPAMGSAAALNVPSSGDATSSQVVKGSDTRLTDARTPLAHTHAISAIIGLQAALDAKAGTFTAGAAVADSVTNSPTNAATNATTTNTGGAATNSPTDAPTNLNVVTTLLGTLTGEVNATNGRQNTIATNLNDLSTKFNALVTAVNDMATKYNATAGKLNTTATNANDNATNDNTVKSRLRALGLISP